MPEHAAKQLAGLLEADHLELDEELPADLPEEAAIEGAKSRYTLIVELGRRERLTVRQLNIMPAVLPSGLERFAGEVLPILRRRDLFRSEYTGQTLREHCGLPRPASQFAALSV